LTDAERSQRSQANRASRLQQEGRTVRAFVQVGRPAKLAGLDASGRQREAVPDAAMVIARASVRAEITSEPLAH
jgi:hypothetical protein